MLIDLVEASKRLNDWRESKASLEVHVSLASPGLWADVWGSIREVKGTVVDIASDGTTLRLQLREAIFDWREDAPSTSNFTTALLAEFRNGDSFLFSALREIK